jgi:hypothetical protein
MPAGVDQNQSPSSCHLHAGMTEMLLQRGCKGLPVLAQVPVRELVRAPVRGRKVVLLGDTCNSRAMLRAPPSHSHGLRPGLPRLHSTPLQCATLLSLSP